MTRVNLASMLPDSTPIHLCNWRVWVLFSQEDSLYRCIEYLTDSGLTCCYTNNKLKLGCLQTTVPLSLKEYFK